MTGQRHDVAAILKLVATYNDGKKEKDGSRLQFIGHDHFRGCDKTKYVATRIVQIAIN